MTTRSTVSLDSYDCPPPTWRHRLYWKLFGWLVMWPHRRRTKKLLRLLEKARQR